MMISNDDGDDEEEDEDLRRTIKSYARKCLADERILDALEGDASSVFVSHLVDKRHELVSDDSEESNSEDPKD